MRYHFSQIPTLALARGEASPDGGDSCAGQFFRPREAGPIPDGTSETAPRHSGTLRTRPPWNHLSFSDRNLL